MLKRTYSQHPLEAISKEIDDSAPPYQSLAERKHLEAFDAVDDYLA
jgi:hypothetical protein